MANKGWPSTAGGANSVSSTARTTGDSTPIDQAQGMIQGSQIAAHDSSGDTMGDRDDYFEVPGQLSTS